LTTIAATLLRSFSENSGLTASEKVVRYISPELRDLWQLLDGYNTLDWARFKQRIKEIYADDDPLGRYSKELLEFTQHTGCMLMRERLWIRCLDAF